MSLVSEVRRSKVAISWAPAPRPVPNSKRPLVTWSSMATRSALRTGWFTGRERLMMAEPRWMRSVWAATNGMTTSGADMWEYSVRPWCSPNHTYFQLKASAWTAYWISRISIVCSDSVSRDAGPGR
jgi:hypothetical protein